jgi:RNA methyltransferase, TrmH family
MELGSAQNPLLKSIRRAAGTGQATDDDLIVAEGPHLLEEALRSFWSVERIITTANGSQKYRDLLQAARAEIIQVSSRAFAATASTETAQEVLALLRPRKWQLSDLLQDPALLVVLDAVGDPGNAGTIVRSAEAFGATGLVFLRGCVRLANGKFLRAAAGSLFRLPFLNEVSAEDFIQETRKHRIETYALTATGKVAITAADLRQPCCLITGNEGIGVSKYIMSQSNLIRIPTRKVESLNAAVACSLGLFEAYRQRAL